MPGNVLFVTADQWRGDSLSALGHPLVRTPHLDALTASGVLFANHWAVTAPCGPSRASLYTGTYLHRHRSVLNGTPLDASLTNVALEARRAGYDPVLFGYTDASVDPRTVPDGDPSFFTYEGVLPGFRPIVHDPFEAGSLEWGKWLAARGRDVPSNPHKLYEPDLTYRGATDHSFTWAPGHFSAEETETAFMTEQVISFLEREADRPFFVPFLPPPASAVQEPSGVSRPLRRRRRTDLRRAPDSHSRTGGPPTAGRARPHARMPGVGAAKDERERRQLRATYHGMQTEVDAQLGRLFAWLGASGLAGDTLVVLTSDHGELGGDHWCIGKGGWFDASFRVPLVVHDPRVDADAGRGRIVDAVTEAVDAMPTILEWIGVEIPLQVDGWSLKWALEGLEPPEHWRDAAHMEWDFRNPVRR